VHPVHLSQEQKLNIVAALRAECVERRHELDRRRRRLVAAPIVDFDELVHLQSECEGLSRAEERLSVAAATLGVR
jgi:hypothetical protein